MAKEYSEGHSQFAVPLTSIYQKDVLVPQYYDMSSIGTLATHIGFNRVLAHSRTYAYDGEKKYLVLN